MTASGVAGTIYTGVTADIIKRVSEHKVGTFKGFSSKYQTINLVWYEEHGDITEAIRREKQLKKWNRAWKIRVIEETNRDWRDLFPKLVGGKQALK